MFGVGVDAIVVLVTVLGGNLVAGAAFVPVLILGARWATIRAAGTFTPVERVPDRWLSALVERLNRAVPAPAAGR